MNNPPMNNLETPPDIHPTAFVRDTVVLGRPATVGAFCLLGEIPAGQANADLPALMLGEHSVIRSHTVLYYGSSIGSHFQTGHQVLIRESNRIGNHVSVGTGTVVEHHVTIADHVRLHSQVFVPEYSILETGCWLGPNVVITNAKYPQSPGVKDSLKGAHIKAGAKIGANATLLPGVTIGSNALVGAGSVVTRDVPDFAVVVGNPAVQIKDIRELPYGISAE